MLDVERRVCFLNAVLALSDSLQTVEAVLWNEAVFGHREERMSWIRDSRRQCGSGVPAKIFKTQLAEKLLTNATAVMILDGVMRLIMNNQQFFFSKGPLWTVWVTRDLKLISPATWVYQLVPQLGEWGRGGGGKNTLILTFLDDVNVCSSVISLRLRNLARHLPASQLSYLDLL